MGVSIERPAIIKGLDDVYVKESEICLVDGEKGRLLYVGYDIRDLVKHSSFEETCFLLWNLRLPNREELERIKRAIAEERKLPKEIVALLRALPKKTQPMDALRTATSALAGFEAELEDRSREANLRKAQRLTAKFATIVAAFHRIRQGKDPLPPDPQRGHAEDFLRMMTGEDDPDPFHTEIMDDSLIMHADHSLNASTFAATVCASTMADLYAVVTAGVSTLKGPLHGGANERALNMLLKIGSPANVEAYVNDMLAKKQKISGFGHRVYKNYDPRAIVLQEHSKKLAERTGNKVMFDTALAVQEKMLRELEEKRVYPNVDFYSGLAYHLMDIPADLFTPIFAVARVAGWSAHVIEYWKSPRIIRPLDAYTGPTEAKYVPVDKR